MTERIDHVAKARAVLAEIEQMDPQTQWVEMTQKQLVVTSHIGLASVEQQRIANFLTFWALSDHEIKNLGNDIAFGVARGGIREGLGL